MIKKVLVIILSMGLLVSILSGCSAKTVANNSSNSTANLKTYKGNLTMWTWDTNFALSLKDQLKKYNPNLNLVVTNIDIASEDQKLTIALSSGIALPDLVMIENGSLSEFKDNTKFEDLSAAPYNANANKGLYYDFFWNLPKASDGKIRTYPLFPGMGATFYRRDIAKKYFGTDDPTKLEKMMPTMAAAFEKGQELKAKSNGKISMIDNAITIYSDLVQAQKKPYVDSTGKLQLENTVLDPLKQAIGWRNAGLDAELTPNVGAWGSSFVKGNVFMYISGSWFGKWNIEANDKDNVTKGLWGVMATPGGTVNCGGNFMAIPSSGKNKELSWQLIKFISNTALQLEYMDKGGVLSPLKSMKNNPAIEVPDAFFANQKVNQKYYQLANNIIYKQLTKYDTAIDQILTGKVTDAINGKLTANNAIKQSNAAIISQLGGEVH